MCIGAPRQRGFSRRPSRIRGCEGRSKAARAAPSDPGALSARAHPTVVCALKGSFIVKVLHSKRARSSLVVNVASSVGNLLLTISIARGVGVSAFGAYAVSGSVFILTLGVVRAAVTEGVLGRAGAWDDVRARARDVSLLGVTLSGATIAFGAFLNQRFLLFLGISMHGLIFEDFVKVSCLALGRAKVALVQELWWTSITFLVVLTAHLSSMSAEIVYLLWGISGAAVGYFNAVRLALPLLPGWTADARASRLAGLYAADYLSGSGTGQLAFNILAASAGPQTVAALRGGGTVLSPVTLVGSSARSLLILFMARNTRGRDARQIHDATSASAVLVLLVLPFVILVQLIPDSLGQTLLGQTWAPTKPLLLPLGLEALLALLAGTAFAGHRAHQAGGRTLAIRSLVGLFRIAVVVLAALQWGAPGAAWAIALVALVSGVFWWLSYAALVRRASL